MFCLLDLLVVLLNVLAWIIIVARISNMKLYEKLCDSVDCPTVLNEAFIVGIVVSVVGAIFVC